MPTEDQGQLELLRQARDRAARLVEDLRRRRDDLREHGSEFEEGRRAMDNAVASAERMLAAVEEASRVANTTTERSEDT